MSNTTTDLSDTVWPPTYTNPNVPTLDMNGNLVGLNSLSTLTLTVNGASLDNTQIGYLNGITPGTSTASKALVMDSNNAIQGIGSLSLSGTVNDSLQITNTSTTGRADMRFINDTKFFEIGNRGSAASDPKSGFYISDSVAGYRMVIASNGNVSLGGVASTIPAKTLTVNGDIQASSEFYRNGTLIFSSALTGVSDTSGAVANKCLILDSSKSITGITSLSSTGLTATTMTATTYNVGANAIFASALTNVSDTSGAVASKCLILDSNKSITGITSLSSAGLTSTGTLGVSGTTTLSGILLGGGSTVNYTATANSESLINYTSTSTVLNNIFTTVDNTSRYIYYYGAPTITASSPGTTTALVSTMYISGPPTAGTNQTITTPYAFIVGSGRSRFGGNSTYTSTTGTGQVMTIQAATYTASGISGTDANHRSYVSIGAQTLTSASAATTTTASTLFIAGPPVAAGSMTITNAYSLYVNSGDAYIGGNATIKSTLLVAPGTTPSIDTTRLIQALDTTQTGAAARYITMGKAYASQDSCAITYSWTSTGSTSNYMGLGLYGTSSFNSTLVIAGTGNVGIGNTSPSFNLDITGTLRTTGAATVNSISTTAGATVGGTLTVNGTGPHVFAGTITATLSSGAQTGITSIGTLSTLSVSGTVSIGASNITTTIAGYLAGATTTNTNASSVLMCDASKNLGGVNQITTTSFYTSGTQLSYLSTDPSSVESAIYGKLTTLNNTSATGTDANHRALMYLKQPTLSSANAITTTTASTLRIDGAPTTGGSQTITNRFALYANGPIYTAGTSSYIINSTYERVQQWYSDAVSPISVELYIDNRNKSTATYSAQFGTTSPNEFALLTSNTRRFYITSGGDTNVVNNLVVGTSTTTPYIMIGTSTDSTRLISALDSSMVATNLRYITLGRDTSTNNQAEMSFYYAGSGSTSNQLRFGFAGGYVMYMGFNNRIGIMNASPSRELDVIGSIAASTGYYISATQVIDGSRNASFANISGTITTGAQTQITQLGTLSGLTISSSSADSLTITNTSSAAAASILLTNDTPRSVSFGLKGSLVSGVGSYIYMYDNTSSAYRMVIDTSGRVGLGMSAPLFPLDLGTNGVSGTDQIVSIWSNSSSMYGFGANGGFLKCQGSTGVSFFYGATRSTVGTEQVRITSSGMGIGTTTITRLLEVNGSFNCTSFYIGGTQITATAAELNYVDITAAGTAQASKALVLDASSNITAINNLTATGMITSAIADITNYLQVGTSTDTARMISVGVSSIANTTRKAIFTGGKLNSTSNQFELNYYHVADGNVSNRLEIGCYGTIGILTVQFDSKVGINSLTPAYALDVVGDINTTQTIKVGGTTIVDSSRNATFNNITGTLLTATQSNITQVGTLTQLKVSADVLVSDTNSLTFSNNLSTGAVRAKIRGDGVAPSLIFDTSSGSGGYMQFFTKKGTTLKCFEVNDSGAANNALSIYADNKIGINKPSSTASLSYNLDVAGSINFTSLYSNGTSIVDSSQNATFATVNYARATSTGTAISYATTDAIGTMNIQHVIPTTLTNTSAAGTDGIHRAGVFIEAPTLTSTNAITTTTAATFYVNGAPTAGTNQTLSNRWAIYANGTCYINGIVSPAAISITSTTNSTSKTTGALIVGGGAGINNDVFIGGAANIAGGITGTLQTGSQPNITSVGTLAGLNLSNNSTDMTINGASGFMYMGTTNNNDVCIYRNSIIVAKWNATGLRLGDSTNASYPLDVNGDISLTGSLRNGGTVLMNSSGVLQNAAQSNITSVGTLTSLTLSSIANNILTVQNTNTGGHGNILFKAAGSTDIEMGLRGSTDTSPVSGFYIYQGGYRFCISNTGNVGIANRTPAYTLDVSGDISLSGSLRNGGTILMNSSGVLQNAAQTNITSVGTLAGLTLSAALTESDTTDSSSISTGSIITSGGVGIAKNLYVGTGIYGSLNGTLTYSGTNNSPISISNTSSTGRATILFSNDTSTLELGYRGTGLAPNGAFYIYKGSYWFVIDSTGKVGLGGNSSPAKTLDITGTLQTSGAYTNTDTTQSTASTNGSVILSGGIGIAKDIYCNGVVNITGSKSQSYSSATLTWFSNTDTALQHSTTWTGNISLSMLTSAGIAISGVIIAASDRRIKKNIEYLTEIDNDRIIAGIKNINPCRFAYKSTDEPSFGVIAQDCVKNNMKEVVYLTENKELEVEQEGDPEGAQICIDYDKLSCYAIVCIKDLYKKIERLEQLLNQT